MSVQWKDSWKLFLVGLLVVGLLVLLVVVVVGNSNASSVKESINQTVQNVIRGQIFASVNSENKITFSNDLKTRSLDDPDPVVQRWDFKKGDKTRYIYVIDSGKYIFFGMMCEEGQYITRTKGGVWTFPEYSDTTGEFREYGTTTLDCYLSDKCYPDVTGTIIRKSSEVSQTQPSKEKVPECPK